MTHPTDPTSSHAAGHIYKPPGIPTRGDFSRAALEASDLTNLSPREAIIESNEQYDGFLRSPRLEQMGLKGLGHQVTAKKMPSAPRVVVSSRNVFSNQGFTEGLALLKGKPFHGHAHKKHY